MNENIASLTFSIKKVCRVCLSTTELLSPMSDDHIKFYINLVDEIVYKECSMKICMICQWMFRRLAKFKHQCLTANHWLKEAINTDSKSLLLNSSLLSSHRLTQTSPTTHTYSPPTHVNTMFYTTYTHTHNKDTNDNQGDSDHDSINALANHDSTAEDDKYINENHDCRADNKYTNVNHDCSAENGKYTNDNHDYKAKYGKYTTDNHDYKAGNGKCTNDNHDYKAENDKYTNENDTRDNNDDEDELPLVMFSNKSRSTKKRKKKKKDLEKMLVPKELATLHESAVKQETEMDVTADEAEKRRSKKVLRDGFTSRMVQETSEYIVIKLTREQVLGEMAERSKTDAYVSSPFKCERCVKGFNFQDVLDTHMEKHSAKNGAFTCEMCGQCCPSAVSLRGHVKSHTTRYKCKVCGAVRVARQHLMEHHALHSDSAPAYECLHCTFTTNKRTVMQRHARGHARGEPHACDKCGKLFKTIDYLRLHAARHDKSSRFKCALCPDTFVYHSLLRRHVQCVHERREFYCVECDVHFKCAESLRVHFKRAKRHRDSTAPNHACSKCEARFYTAGALAAHRSAAHGASSQHACLHCPRIYSTRDAVRAHTWRVHARGDARAACPHCHTSFARKSVLKAHLRARNGACAVRDHLEKEEVPQYEGKIEV